MAKPMAGPSGGVMSGAQRLLRAVMPMLACALLSGWAAAQDVVEYYELDSVGNVLVVTNAQGAAVEQHDYLPFGEELCGTVPCGAPTAGQPRRFTGKERDAETGLDYFGARYYQAKHARFTTVDPVYTWRDNLVDPQRWNRCAYGRNNPLRYVDPDGRQIAATALMITVPSPPGNEEAKLDFAIGFAEGVLMLIPGLEIQANSPAQANGQITGLLATLGATAALAPRTGARTGVQANKAVGDAWSRAVGAELKATHEVAVPEITVRTQSGAKTRLDWVTKDGGGTIGCIECKASPTAPLTRGQAAAHPEIAQTGAVVAGKGKPGVPGGTAIPPTQVQVRRPQ